MTPAAGSTVALISEIAADPRLPTRLHAAGFRTIDRIGLAANAPTKALVEAIGDSWAVIAGGEQYDAAAMDRLSQLRVILRPGAGYDTIDVEAASQRGILVATTPGANAEAVADMTIALMLACLRQIRIADQAVRSGRWRPDVTQSRDLFRRTVGIVGLGRIGRAVAQRLRGFECHLLAYDPLADRAFAEQHAIGLRSFQDLLRESEVVTLHLPLVPETRHLFGPVAFGLMQPDSVLINTSRGAIVDEQALITALDDGRLSSAGLDVFETEPLPLGHPFLSRPTMVLTGHLASYTDGAYDRMLDGALQALCDARDGRAPLGAVNPQVVATGDLAG
jgi:D-3-phosphoglycerate dehydrogenase